MSLFYFKNMKKTKNNNKYSEHIDYKTKGKGLVERPATRHFNSKYFKDYFDSSCIYYLYCNENIVYIGQTERLMPRVVDHFRSNKLFTRFSFFSCAHVSRQQRLAFELRLIKKHKPHYNMIGNNEYGVTQIE